MTVRDFRDALSADFQALWVLDRHGRHWRVEDGACATALKMGINGYKDDDKIVAISDRGEVVVSASGNVPAGLTFVKEFSGQGDFVLSGDVLNAKSYHATV